MIISNIVKYIFLNFEMDLTVLFRSRIQSDTEPAPQYSITI